MKVLHSIILLLPLVGLTLTQEYVSSDPASYQFSYNTGDEGPAKMFREEQRAATGQVTGKYGYVDPYGHMRIVQYEAGPQGFIARGDVGPDREAMRIARQLADQDYQEKFPILQQWNTVAARLAAGPSIATPSTSKTWSTPTQNTGSSPALASPVERARLTDYSSTGAHTASAWGVAPSARLSASTPGGHSFTNQVTHYSSNINSVWPSSSNQIRTHSAPLVAAAAAPAPVDTTGYFNGAPQTWFRMSSTGPSPYNIAYSY